jgi:DNA-binding response OmpR family regulator
MVWSRFPFFLQERIYSSVSATKIYRMKKRILILDDNLDILEIVEEVLQYEGYDVSATREKSEFDERLKNWKPDLIILDFKLDGCNGGEICTEIKRNEATSYVPVILFSAYFSKEEELWRYECDGVIMKPFDLEVLSERVKTILN